MIGQKENKNYNKINDNSNKNEIYDIIKALMSYDECYKPKKLVFKEGSCYSLEYFPKNKLLFLKVSFYGRCEKKCCGGEKYFESPSYFFIKYNILENKFIYQKMNKFIDGICKELSDGNLIILENDVSNKIQYLKINHIIYKDQGNEDNEDSEDSEDSNSKFISDFRLIKKIKIDYDDNKFEIPFDAVDNNVFTIRNSKIALIFFKNDEDYSKTILKCENTKIILFNQYTILAFNNGTSNSLNIKQYTINDQIINIKENKTVKLIDYIEIFNIRKFNQTHLIINNSSYIFFINVKYLEIDKIFEIPLGNKFIFSKNNKNLIFNKGNVFKIYKINKYLEIEDSKNDKQLTSDAKIDDCFCHLFRNKLVVAFNYSVESEFIDDDINVEINMI